MRARACGDLSVSVELCTLASNSSLFLLPRQHRLAGVFDVVASA